MTILSAQTILRRATSIEKVPSFQLKIEPFINTTKQYKGKSYGLTAAGYDIRIGRIRHPLRDHELVERIHLKPGEFLLAASFEHIRVPIDLQVIVHDKSSWARKGLALQNTVLEPGWEGFITLELSNHGGEHLLIEGGTPIAQLIFHQLDMPTNLPYNGKYQNQGPSPTFSIDHSGDDDE